VRCGDGRGLKDAKTDMVGAGWSSPVARQAHNLKVTGSNPVPATKFPLYWGFPLDISSRSATWHSTSTAPVRRSSVGVTPIAVSSFPHLLHHIVLGLVDRP
jgi:hypothetical protein